MLHVWASHVTFFASQIYPPVQSNDHDRLVLFIQRLDELKARNCFKQFGMQVTPATISFSTPTHDALDAFVVSYRHFHATNRPVVLAKRTKWLIGHHLLVIRALAIKALKPGPFTSEIQHPVDDASPTVRTYQIPV